MPIKFLNDVAVDSNVLYVDTINNRVGIGTTSPGTKLHVGSTSTSGVTTEEFRLQSGTSSGNGGTVVANLVTGNFGISGIYFGNFTTYTSQPAYLKYARSDNSTTLGFDVRFSINQGTSGTRFHINNIGNVGIGTTSPVQKVHIDGGSSNAYLHFSNTDTGASASDGADIGITNDEDLIVWNREARNLRLATSGIERIRINSSGNVGIGTTNPSSKLEVSGDIKSIYNGKIGFRYTSGDSNMYQYITANGNSPMSFYNNYSGGLTYTAYSFKATSSNTDVLTILSGGNVGIGTTSPGEKLSIAPGTDASGEFGQAHIGLVGYSGYAGFSHINRNSDGNYALLQHGDGTTFLNASSGESVRFRIANSDKMILDSSGRVGIGTTSPNQKLTIKGTDQYVAAEQTNYVWGGTTTIGVRMGTDATAGLLDFRRWTGTATTHGTALITQVNSDGGYGLDFRVDDKSTNTSATTSRMFLSKSGEVGIGTTSPDAKTHVFNSVVENGLIIENSSSSFVDSALFANNTSTTNGNLLRLRSSGVDRVVVLGTGNVGIGTTSPSFKLDVSGTGRFTSYLSFNNQGYIRGDFSGELRLQGGSTATTFYNSSNSSELMRITQGGNVGVGITSPAAKLHMGTASASGSTTEEFRIQTGTGSGYGGNAVVNLNTGAFGKSGIYFGNNGGLSYANQDSFLEYNDYSGETKLNFGNTLTINKGTSSAIYIDSFGRVGLGTTTPQYQLQLSTNSAAKPTSSSWTVVSDERVKTNIRPYETGLKELLQIEPKLFDYNGKAGFDATTKNNIGVIAQEIKDVMPETVNTYEAKLNEEDEEDTELYNFDSHALTFALINSVKELSAKIESLETKIQTLENQ